MKRVVLVLAVLAGMVFTAASSFAAPARPASRALVRPHVLLKTSAGPAVTRIQRQTHAAPQHQTNKPSDQTASQFALPGSAFAPAVLTNIGGPQTLDDVNHGWFAAGATGFHSKNFDNFGFVTGYYERADWTATNPPISFRYQGELLNSTANAVALYNDGVTWVQQQFGTSSKDCSEATVKCRYMVYTYRDASNSSWTEEYDVLQYQACTAELTLSIRSDFVSQYATQASIIQGNIDNAAANLLINVCGSSAPNPTATTASKPTATTVPVSQAVFNVVSVRFEKNGSSADWNLQNPPLTQVKAGTKVDISAYYTITSAPPGTKVTSEFALVQGGKTIMDKKYDENFDGPDTYRTLIKNVTLDKVGKYGLAIRITVNGISDQGSTSIKVTNATVKTPVVKHVSFKFAGLTTNTTGGAQSSSFAVGQPIVVKMSWTVNNLKGHTNATITRSILANFNGSWKAVATNVDSTPTVNGSNTNSHSFTLNAAGQFRIAVRLTLGGKHQDKTVTVTVH